MVVVVEGMIVLVAEVNVVVTMMDIVGA